MREHQALSLALGIRFVFSLWFLYMLINFQYPSYQTWEACLHSDARNDWPWLSGTPASNLWYTWILNNFFRLRLPGKEAQTFSIQDTPSWRRRNCLLKKPEIQKLHQIIKYYIYHFLILSTHIDIREFLLIFLKMLFGPPYLIDLNFIIMFPDLDKENKLYFQNNVKGLCKNTA